MEIENMSMGQLIDLGADLSELIKSNGQRKREVMKQVSRVMALAQDKSESAMHRLVEKESTKYTVPKDKIPEFMEACYVFTLTGVFSAIEISIDKTAFEALDGDDKRKLVEFVDKKKNISRKIVEIEGLDG